jgi:octaprenyl-diphosphate synthase
VDDLLDYEGNSQELGKNVGDDLREGKATLPLLIAMARGTPEQKAVVRQAIELGEVDKLAQIVEIVRSSGAIEATREAAQAQAEQARACLDLLPDSAARRLLADLALQSVRRST